MTNFLPTELADHLADLDMYDQKKKLNMIDGNAALKCII